MSEGVKPRMRAGDTVKHGPSGETWWLGGADMERDEVYPCGWPETIAKASDCTLVEAATDEEHWKLVEGIAANKDSPDVRASHCRHLIHLRDQMAFDKQHRQPGRRFAKGATWDDIKLGSFGLVSHLLFFMFLGALAQHLWPDENILLWVTGILALICLVIRGGQVGSSTTKESLAAIQRAFLLNELDKKNNPPDQVQGG